MLTTVNGITHIRRDPIHENASFSFTNGIADHHTETKLIRNSFEPGRIPRSFLYFCVGRCQITDKIGMTLAIERGQ